MNPSPQNYDWLEALFDGMSQPQPSATDDEFSQRFTDFIKEQNQ